MNFEKTELELTKEMINAGLEKAAQSMAFFTKEKVTIQSTDVQIRPLSSMGELLNKEGGTELTILTTKIMGEIGGVCYLIFSEAEVKELLNVSLPESILNDSEKLAVMSNAILLEMDNIIVAAVITQLANSLNTKMYGNVPVLTKSVPNGFDQIFESANKISDYFLYFKSEFTMENLNINPDFIWLLDRSYLDAIKNIKGTQNEIINKIRNESNQ